MGKAAELTWHATTAANLLQAQKKQTLLGRKKSRAGCVTCKIRRVKCDESRPVCQRCTSTGRKCDGYPAPAKRRSPGTSVIGVQLSHSLGLKDSERRTFDYFLSWTAPRLAGSLDRDFWCGQVLQYASSEPLVLDALLAISTLYEHPQFMKSFLVDSDTKSGSSVSNFDNAGEASAANSTRSEDESPIHPSFKRLPVDSFHADALRHYNRAIQTFKGKMLSGKVAPGLALLSCALFLCIEIIRDDVYAALKLYMSGKELLKTLPTQPNAFEEELYMTVKLMLARLGVLAAVFGHDQPLEVPQEFVDVGKHRVFANMADARTGLFALMANSHAYIREATLYKVKCGFTVPKASGLYDTSYAASDLIAETGQAVLPATFHVRPDLGVTREDHSRIFSPTNRHQCQESADVKIAGLCPGRCGTSGNKKNTLFQDSESPPESLVRWQTEMELQLGQWLDAFQWIRDSDEEAASCLMMHYHVSFIWQTTRLAQSQMVFDDYTWHFKEILRFATLYINAKPPDRPITFEVGCIPALYFVATKCRMRAIRRQALELLQRAPRKECMWGAQSVADLATHIINIEEEGVCVRTSSGSGPDDTTVPTDDFRIHFLEILPNETTGRFEVRVTKYRIGDDCQRHRSVFVYPM